MTCCIILFEFVKGNYSVIYSACALAQHAWEHIDWTSICILGIGTRVTCLMCMRNSSSPLPCSAGLEHPPHFTNIAGITTVDLVHNTGLVTIRNVVLRMGENPSCAHVHLNLSV